MEHHDSVALREAIGTGSGILIRRISTLAGLLALGAISVTVSGVGAASAQPYYVGPRYYAPGLPPGAIIGIVQRAGFTPLTAPMRHGPNYVVVATGRGGQVRVVVNAFAGDIVAVRPLIAMRPFGPPVAALPPAYGAPPAPPASAYRAPPSSLSAMPPPAPPATAYDPEPLRPPVATAPRNVGEPAPVRSSAGLDTGTLPAPSRGFANPKLASAPPTPAAAAAPKMPERTPLPRPRPSVASIAAPAAAAPTASVPATTTTGSMFRRRMAPGLAPGDLPPETETTPAAAPARPAVTTTVPVAPLD
jgi:hypothetical protein